MNLSFVFAVVIENLRCSSLLLNEFFLSMQTDATSSLFTLKMVAGVHLFN